MARAKKMMEKKETRKHWRSLWKDSRSVFFIPLLLKAILQTAFSKPVERTQSLECLTWFLLISWISSYTVRNSCGLDPVEGRKQISELQKLPKGLLFRLALMTDPLPGTLDGQDLKNDSRKELCWFCSLPKVQSGITTPDILSLLSWAVPPAPWRSDCIYHRKQEQG